ncbi:MAG: ATP-binding protein [Acidobacteria bacterium]|nr:ATP-binding protein [Acidobacteriota bacterium]
MTARLGKNPYRPGVGTRPLYLAGRDQEIRRFQAVLRSSPEIPANVRLTGLRGVGKTVLLSEFEAQAEEANWATGRLELEPRHDTEATLTSALVSLCERATQRISKIERAKAAVGRVARGAVKTLSVTLQDVTLSCDPLVGSHGRDLAKALFDVVETAVKKGSEGFVLLLDEAQILRDEAARAGEHPLSLLVAAVSAFQRASLPIALVMCGLPTLTGNLLKARTYTERMFRGEEIGSLDGESARKAFVEPLKNTPISADRDLVESVLACVEGYPYFIQLWGAELWDAAEAATVDRFTPELLAGIEPDIYRRVDSDFYEPRVRTLTPAEQDVLSAAAMCPYPPLLVSHLNRASDKTSGNVNVLLGRLVEAGVLFRLRKGQYEYTAPKFHEFLLRRTSERDARLGGVP